MDTDIVPLGERALRSILDRVQAVGDEAETTYLEVKSEIDLTKTGGIAKVAKFLLGASNRIPAKAAQYFQGYAVLVISAGKGQSNGVPRGTEAHELEDKLRQYVGPEFPGFEFGRIAVGNDREVLFVIALPPLDGQTIFPCHKGFHGDKGQDSLNDGAIYVRGTSNTRSARAGEVLALVERARRAGKSPINIDVEVLGSVNRVERADQMLESLYDLAEKKYLESRNDSMTVFSSAPLHRRYRNQQQAPISPKRAKRLEAWKREKTRHIAIGREHFLGAALHGTGVRVLSHDRFVAKPHLIITFHDCEAIRHIDADDADYDIVVEPIEEDNSFSVTSLNLHNVHRDYPVTWTNRGHDVEVVLTPESFRPNVVWASNQDDYVLLARDPLAQEITVRWVLTEENNDVTTTGQLVIPAAEPLDAVGLFTETFLDDAQTSD